MKHAIYASFIAVVGSTAVLACGDDEIDRTVDCAEICSRYSNCVTDIDVTDCTDYCEDQADANEAVEQAADQCDECIEDKSCAEAAECIPSCTLVPIGGD